MRKTNRTGLATILLSFLMLMPIAAAGVEAGSGKFVALSDIHAFADGDGGPVATFGPATCPTGGAVCPTCDPNAPDTKKPLFESFLQDLACQKAQDVDFVIMTGDWLAHFYQAPGDPTDKKQIIATLTSLLRKQFGQDMLIIPALGNNDAYQGDYNLQPQGQFLQDTMALWQPIFPDSAHLGTCLDDQPPGNDFEESFLAGGYYAFSNPKLPNNCTLVLNTTLLVPNYIYAWRTNGFGAAETQMTWLADRLAEARAATPPKDVWLLYHVPPGANPYSSSQNKSATMMYTDGTLPATDPAPDFTTHFSDLIVANQDIIKAQFAGHTHDDSFRVVFGDQGQPDSWVHITPSVTPDHHSGRSAYQIFDYTIDAGRAVISDFTTRHLNFQTPSAATWQTEYVWKQSFCDSSCDYDPASLNGVYEELHQPTDPYSTRYRKFYGERTGSSTPAISSADWPYYLCAIGNVLESSYTSCVAALQ